MYTIGKLAEQASINVETVRYYERRGLIEKPEKPHLGYRLYPLSIGTLIDPPICGVMDPL